MKVLLSIKPEFANKIFNVSKKFEFRRAIFKNPDIRKIVVYASSPVQKVIGEFEIERIHRHDLATLWNLTEHYSGISKDYFLQYFGDKEVGFAIEIKNTELDQTSKCLRKDYNLVPPQSFLYLG